MDHEVSRLLLLFAALTTAMVAVLYFVAPIVVFLVQRISAKPELIPFDAAATPIPQPASNHLAEVGAALEAEGFTPTPTFFLPRHAPRLKAIVRNYYNRRLSTVASAVVVFTEAGAGRWTHVAYTSFTTRYGEGGFVITNNVSALDVFSRAENRRVTSLPSVADVRRLLRCHRILCDRYVTSTPSFPSEIESDPRSVAVAAILRDLDEQVQRGIFRLADEGANYRPTVRGAIQITWSHFWPMRWVFVAVRRKAERQLVEEEARRVNL